MSRPHARPARRPVWWSFSTGRMLEKYCRSFLHCISVVLEKYSLYK